MAMQKCVPDASVVGIGGDLVVGACCYLALWPFSIACVVLLII
jgi:hypothetical protein